MKLQMFTMIVFVTSNIGLVVHFYSKRKFATQLNRTSSFVQVKYQVSSDLLNEFKSDTVKISSMLDQTKVQIEKLDTEMKGIKGNTERNAVLLESCNLNLKQVNDEVTVAESEKNNFASELQKKKEDWAIQLQNIKKEMEQESKICKYIDKKSEGMSLCPITSKELEKVTPKKVIAEAPQEVKPKQEGGTAEAPQEVKEKKE